MNHPPLTLEKLYYPHASQPNNPLIAEPLFLTKYIEKAGAGTVDMLDPCRGAGMKRPEFCTDAGFFILTVWCKAPETGPGTATAQVTAQVTTEVTAQVAGEVTGEAAGEVTAPVTASVTAPVRRILELLSTRGELSNAEILDAFGLKSRRHMREACLEPALRESLIEYTIPDKPTSSHQEYRLTEKGRAWLAERILEIEDTHG